MAGQAITIGQQCGSGGHTIGEQAANHHGTCRKRTLCDRGTLCGFYSERNRKQSEYLYSCGKSI